MFLQRLYSLLHMVTEISVFISTVSQLFARDFLKDFEQKKEQTNKQRKTKKQKLKQKNYFADWFCWNTPLTLIKVTYHSALAFTSCLCRAQRSARGASLRLSQVFCEHASSPGHVCFTLNSLVFVLASHKEKSLFLQACSSSVFSFPDFWVCLPACLIFCPLPQAAMCSMSLNVFNRCYLESCSSSRG